MVPVTAPLGRTRLLMRLRKGCAAAVLVELRTRAVTQPGRLWTVPQLAGKLSYAPATVRDALHLARAAGMVRQESIPDGGRPVTRWALTGEGLAFATTIRTEAGK